MSNQHLPGLALAVIHDGKPVKVKTYGLSNLELNTPVTPDTVFRIASMSKQIIATAAMLLVQDGALSLDDPICKYLEDCPEAWRAITVTQVLSHTSGLANEAPGNNPLLTESDMDVIRRAYPVPLKSKPGEKWLYSNLGYSVAAEIIHKASGRPWPQIIAERIFMPLGMNDTRTTSLTDLVPNRAAGYQFRDNRQGNALPPIQLRPSGAFLSTLADLIKWDAAVTAGKLLPKPVQDQMWTPVRLSDGSSTQYGFGWWVDEVAGHRRIRHGGSQPGFRTEYSRFVDEHLNVIVLVNGESTRPDDIALEVANQFIPGLVNDRKTIRLSPSELAPYAGRYRVGSSSILTIGVDGSGLSIQSSDCCAQFHLLAETPSVFFLSKDESYVFTREGDQVAQLEVRFGTAASAGASELKAPRIP
jgi:CubicO group peptidase (beta-lactamase class C family)